MYNNNRNKKKGKRKMQEVFVVLEGSKHTDCYIEPPFASVMCVCETEEQAKKIADYRNSISTLYTYTVERSSFYPKANN